MKETVSDEASLAKISGEFTHSYIICPIATAYSMGQIIQDPQLSQRESAAGCVIVLAKRRRLELGDNILQTL